MNHLTESCSKMLRMTLAKEFTSVSYAILKDNEIIAADSLGWQNTKEKQPATLKSTYNVASVSKIYCTAAVMKLVEMKKLELEDKVAQLVPEFSMPDERYKEITVRHLLNHASGLPGTQWKGFSISSITPRSFYDEVLDYFRHSHLKAMPGEYSVYCNDGFTLAEIVVEKVSGMPFDQFVYKMITNPIEAYSSRYIPEYNPDYPLVMEKEKPSELLLVKGAGGLTTCMTDLCRFGQLFLEGSEVLSEESIREMAKPQGMTFLKEDQKSPLYGLGWDCVSFSDPHFCLGEGVLQKGGNSVQFTSQLLVIPQFKAVLAISHTHDCKIDCIQTILNLFALCTREMGLDITVNQKRIPTDYIKSVSGTYLMPSSIMDIQMAGSIAHIQYKPIKKEPYPMVSYLRYDGEILQDKDTQGYFFASHEDDWYLMSRKNNQSWPIAMKAKNFAPLSETWKKRIGKKYIAINGTHNDLIIGDLMTGFTIESLEGFEGILIASFSGREGSDIFTGGFDASFIPETDDIGKSFLSTPCHASRDLIDPFFETIEGIEYCHVASYYYQEVDSLPIYHQEGFKESSYNQAYRIAEEMKDFPEIPESHRILILDSKLNVVQDSLMKKELTPIEEGFMLFM